MELKDLKNKDDEDLKDILADSKEKLRELNFKVSSGQLKDVRQIRKTRKQIAQILTLLKERKG